MAPAEHNSRLIQTLGASFSKTSLNLIVMLAVTLFSLNFSVTANAQIEIIDSYAGQGFAPFPFVSETNIEQYLVPDDIKEKTINAFCHRVQQKFKDYSWKEKPCGEISWKVKFKSTNEHPLIYAEFGTGKNATLFLGGVHPDELTPIHLAFKFARHLQNNKKIYQKRDIKIIIAPLVNPDGFVRNKPSRTNANGVDVNRNFFTLDWYKKAIKAWRQRRHGKKRYFPGYFPNTEIETLFQVGLIDEFNPGKVISIHAPLGFLDYDGPGDQKAKIASQSERLAKGLVKKMAKTSKNYRVVDYSFYPGSLGNYAGNERGLATITLELQTTNARKVKKYWKQFLPGLILSVQHPFSAPKEKSSAKNSSILRTYTRSETIKNKNKEKGS